VFNSKELEDRIENLRGTIKTMMDVAAINKRKRLRAKRDHDKATKKLAKDLEKEEKKVAKLGVLLDLERLAELEHEQWWYWTKQIADQVPDELREKWEASWIPYDELPEELKEEDRVWARKVRDEE